MNNTKFDQSLNIEHISNNYRDYEAARNSFFVFEVDFNSPNNLGGAKLYKPDIDPDTAVDATVDGGSLYDLNTASEAIRLNVVKTSVPTFSLEVLQYRRGNDVVKFAGVPTFKDGSLTIDDVVGLETKSILYSWQYLAYNPITRKGGRMKDYKKTCTLMEYTQDYELIRTWTLEGCFITGLEEGDFDRESDGKRQITASISYDRATMDLPVVEEE